MSDEQINIAIAEACGWNDVQRPNNEFGRRAYGWMRTEHGNRTLETQIPNYCNDLNAMHEAEKRMRSGDWTRYCQYLAEYGGGTVRFVSVHATAQNRAKAFLKTIGKWEGEK